jgi:hypothetical protein
VDVGTSTPLSTIPSGGGDVGNPEGFGAYETNHLKTKTNLTGTNIRRRDPATLPLELMYIDSGGGREEATGEATVYW